MCIFIHFAISSLQNAAFIHAFMNNFQKITIKFARVKYSSYLCTQISIIWQNNLS